MLPRALLFLLLAIVFPSTLATGRAYGHGFAGSIDLPVPAYLYWYGGASVVALSFVVISLFVRRTSGHGDLRRHNLLHHGWFRRLVESRAALFLIKLPGVAAFLLVITAGLFGNQNPVANFAPTFVWVIWWVGFGFVHALIGNLWAVLNPWKSLYGWATALRGGEAARRRAYPERLGLWPAFLLFLIFVWIELVFPGAANPRTLAFFTLAYSALTWTGMWLYGKDLWLRRGEAFAVFFRFLAGFAPTEVRVQDSAVCERCPVACRVDGECLNCYWCFGHTSARELNLRAPATGLLRREAFGFDHIAFVVLMLSSVTFDGISRTFAWYGWFGIDPFSPLGRAAVVPLNTAGLLGFFALLLGLYYGFIYLVRQFARVDAPIQQIALFFVFSLLPIAMVYQFAHYSTFLLINGQFFIRLLSDPFGLGWDLFGTRYYPLASALDFLAVWHYQVALIIVGHVVGVYLAHLIALRTFNDQRSAVRSQYPMMMLMVIYTILGLWLLSAPAVG